MHSFKRLNFLKIRQKLKFFIWELLLYCKTSQFSDIRSNRLKTAMYDYHIHPIGAKPAQSTEWGSPSFPMNNSCGIVDGGQGRAGSEYGRSGDGGEGRPIFTERRGGRRRRMATPMGSCRCVTSLKASDVQSSQQNSSWRCRKGERKSWCQLVFLCIGHHCRPPPHRSSSDTGLVDFGCRGTGLLHMGL